MIDHISIGVRDLAKAGAFYDAAFGPLGLRRLYDDPGSLGYGRDGIGFWVLPSKSPVPADAASGLHICLSAPDRQSVDRFHRAALEAGGTDNGKPGLRADYGPGYYAAFVVDPDGYRIEAYCGTAA